MEGSPRFTGTLNRGVPFNQSNDGALPWDIHPPGAVRWTLRGHPGCFGVSNNGDNQTTWVSLTEQNYPIYLQYLLLLSNQSPFLCNCPTNRSIEGQHHFLKHISSLHFPSSTVSSARLLIIQVIKHSYGKSPFLMGKSTISMAIFNSYVSLPEGTYYTDVPPARSTPNPCSTQPPSARGCEILCPSVVHGVCKRCDSQGRLGWDLLHRLVGGHLKPWNHDVGQRIIIFYKVLQYS